MDTHRGKNPRSRILGTKPLRTRLKTAVSGRKRGRAVAQDTGKAGEFRLNHGPGKATVPACDPVMRQTTGLPHDRFWRSIAP